MAYRFFVLGWGFALGLALLHFDRPTARACGGCLAPATTPTVVTGHRMAVAIKADRTILWDQFSYAGEAEDFVWVLPVDATMTEVEVAQPLFLDELEAATSPLIVGPPPTFSDEGCSGGCGDDDDATSPPSAAGPRVMVHSMTTVGPYETATISSTSSSALVDWMREHDYAVPRAIEPLIADYTAAGMSFVVVRLQPGVGVRAMTPIRVSYPGTSVSLPLRMIAAGVADDVELLLWVFGEGRYEVANFPNAFIDERELSLDNTTFPRTSNYAQVFDRTLARAGGSAWITESTVAAMSAGSSGVFDARSQTAVSATGRQSPEWQVAMDGLPADAVLTRMRTRLPVEALAFDLLLAPATDGPVSVSRFYYTERTASSASLPAVPALLTAAVAVFLLWSRVRRRRAS